ncbi:MAG: FGGY family carbohydrate kinase [Patescibacteria group bacterium]|mgnify:CR=1 FL=1
MPKKNNILVLDVGTTGVKGLVFNAVFEPIAQSYHTLKKTKKQRGWVEQDPEEILRVSQIALRNTLEKSRVPQQSIIGLGLANQRETTILWDKKTGRAIYPAIVWEDERTKTHCARLKQHETLIRMKTGLKLDPYFSATKIQWILEHVPTAKPLLQKNRLLFGTVDTWILWHFLDGHPHSTDYTNASRTLIFNIKTLRWDADLLKLFGIPKTILPRVKPSSSRFGRMKKSLLGFPLPVLAVCGDQEASLFAAGEKKGVTKITYGTGAFVSQIIGSRFMSREPFFTTLAAHLGKKPLYILEAKVNDCGKTVQEALRHPRTLEKTVRKIAREIARYTKKLPLTPQYIMLDGGVTRYEGLKNIQASASGTPTELQRTYNGTALGVAKLVAKQKPEPISKVPRAAI